MHLDVRVCVSFMTKLKIFGVKFEKATCFPAIIEKMETRNEKLNYKAKLKRTKVK